MSTEGHRVCRCPQTGCKPSDATRSLLFLLVAVIVRGKNLWLEMPNSTFPQGRMSGLAVCTSQDRPGPLLPPAAPQSWGAKRLPPPGEAVPEVPARSVSPEAPVASSEVCYQSVSLWWLHRDLELASRVPIPCLRGTQLIHGGAPLALLTPI